MHVNKEELIDALKDSNGFSKHEAQKVVEVFFDSMANTLARGDRVEIRSLCSFYVKNYEGYTGRNPKTSAPETIKFKRLPFFKPGTDLKNRVD